MGIVSGSASAARGRSSRPASAVGRSCSWSLSSQERLEARARSTRLASIAGRFQSEISLGRGDEWVSGASVLSILCLAGCGPEPEAPGSPASHDPGWDYFSFANTGQIESRRVRAHIAQVSGLSAHADASYRCVLLDLRLPDLPGAEVLRRMRRAEFDPGRAVHRVASMLDRIIDIVQPDILDPGREALHLRP